jgi:hypothetical protein
LITDCQSNLQQKILNDEQVKETIKQKLEKESKTLAQTEAALKQNMTSAKLASRGSMKSLREIRRAVVPTTLDLLPDLRQTIGAPAVGASDLSALELQLEQMIQQADVMTDSTLALAQRVNSLAWVYNNYKTASRSRSQSPPAN